MVRLSDVMNAAASFRARTQKSDATILKEVASTRQTSFDVFLSHSFKDRALVLGTFKILQDAGLSVYVDWIEDGQLDRSKVDRARADQLRTRMGQCDALFYAHTPNAALSKWCPWELGYFDALKAPDRQVFILPIIAEGQRYEGQEYLSLYETVDPATYRPVRKLGRRAISFEEQMLRSSLGFYPPPGKPWL